MVLDLVAIIFVFGRKSWKRSLQPSTESLHFQNLSPFLAFFTSRELTPITYPTKQALFRCAALIAMIMFSSGVAEGRIRRAAAVTFQTPGFITAVEEAADSMALNTLSTLPDILDDFWSVIDNCILKDHSNCRHWRNRPHMLAYFSSTPQEGNELTPHGTHSLSKRIEDSQIVKDLELTLKAITELRNLDTTTKAINRVNEWRLEQRNVMNAEKTVEDDKHTTHSDRQTIQELVKLRNADKDKWKLERDKWKLEKDSLKLTCKRLKDEAGVTEQQLRKLTLESQRWTAEFTRLASAEVEGNKVAEVCRTLLEQHPLQYQILELRRRTGDNQKVSSTFQAPAGKLGRSSDRMCGHLKQSKIDEEIERKGKYKSKSKVQDWASQQQDLQLILERQTREAQSEQENVEELCRYLLDQLERRNLEIKRSEVELGKASKWNALAHQKLMEQREEIKRLNRESQVGECIICTNEFGEDQDRQRAYWKNCNHANICYKCTKTLWNSKKRQCPTCKTSASSMPTPLPPTIYL